MARVPDQPVARRLGPLGRGLVRAHREARLRRPGRRARRPAQPRVLPAVSPAMRLVSLAGLGAAPAGILVSNLALLAALLLLHRMARARFGAEAAFAVRPAAERLPLLLLLQRRLLGEPVPAARRRRAVPRRARALGRRVPLRAPLRRHARARARPRARAGPPLSRAHPIRPAQAATGRPLARAQPCSGPSSSTRTCTSSSATRGSRSRRRGCRAGGRAGSASSPPSGPIRALRSVENLRTGQFPVVFDLNLLAAALCLGSLVSVFRRQPLAWGVFSLLIVASGVLQPGGWGRYVLPAFPVFLAWALALESRLAFAAEPWCSRRSCWRCSRSSTPTGTGWPERRLIRESSPEAGDAGRPARASERSPGRSGTGSRSGRRG